MAKKRSADAATEIGELANEAQKLTAPLVDGGVVEGEPGAIWVAIEKLTPWIKNPRAIKKADVNECAESIKRFGFAAPIVARKANGEIAAGHKRVMAAKQLGMRFVPVRYVDLTEDEAHAYAIADNRMTENTGYNHAVLGEVLADLQSKQVSIAGLGFKPADLHRIIRTAQGGVHDDDVPAVGKEEDAITKRGDVWLLGPHLLFCGDSTQASSFDFLERRPVDMVWTDPPYGIDVVGGDRATPAEQRRQDGQKTIDGDGIDDEKLLSLLRESLGCAFANSNAGASWYVAAPPGPTLFLFAVVLRDLKVWRQTLTWVKDALVPGRSDYHYRNEVLFYGWKPGAGHMRVSDRTQDSVWEIPRPKRSPDHPTMKPVELVARAIRNSSEPGQVVLDPFGGSGTTLIACEHEGRVARLIELSPAYCDVIRTRWEQLTGKQAERVQRA